MNVLVEVVFVDTVFVAMLLFKHHGMRQCIMSKDSFKAFALFILHKIYLSFDPGLSL